MSQSVEEIANVRRSAKQILKNGHTFGPELAMEILRGLARHGDNPHELRKWALGLLGDLCAPEPKG